MDDDDDNMEFNVPHSISLLKAVDDGNECVMRDLLSDNVADFLTQSGNNKLQHVIHHLSNDALPLVRKIIDAGVYIGAVTQHGENIYHLLAKYCEDGEVDYSDLILHNIDLHFQNQEGNSPLMIASFLHNKSVIQCFIDESRCNINLQNEQGHTALHLCIIGFTAIIKSLDCRKSEEFRNQLCDFTYYPNFIGCVNLLINAGIDVNIKDNDGKTALMRAVITNDKNLVENLLKSNSADITILDDYGRAAIQYFNFADYSKDLECFKLLYAKGGNDVLNLPQINGQTIIQNVLTFSSPLDPNQTVLFIKYLIGCNVSLHTLTTLQKESEISHVMSEKLSPEKRMQLRELLYLSCAPASEIITVFNLNKNDEETLTDGQVGQRQSFINFCNKVNLRLEKICRRVIRQTYGLDIRSVAEELPHLSDFLLLEDCPECEIPRSLNNDRFMRNQENNCNVNYNLYDYDGKWLDYEHIQYLNIQSFYNFS